MRGRNRLIQRALPRLRQMLHSRNRRQAAPPRPLPVSGPPVKDPPMPKRSPLLLVTAALAVSGCATKPPASDTEATADFNQTNDPIRARQSLFLPRQRHDRPLLVQAGGTGLRLRGAGAGAHRRAQHAGQPVQPRAVRRRREPGQPAARRRHLHALLINSTAGGLGVFDVANGWGYPAHTHQLRRDAGALGRAERALSLSAAARAEQPRATPPASAWTARWTRSPTCRTDTG